MTPIQTCQQTLILLRIELYLSNQWLHSWCVLSVLLVTGAVCKCAVFLILAYDAGHWQLDGYLLCFGELVHIYYNTRLKNIMVIVYLG